MEPVRKLSRSIAGKVALITGAASGMGRATAHIFAGEGAKVAVLDLKQDRVDAVVAEIKAEGGEAEGWALDVADGDGIIRVVKEIEARFGGLDILVNNAGAAWGADFAEYPESGWDKTMDLNVKSLFFLTQKVHGLMKAAASGDRPGKVINIASIDGIKINPWETYAYQASKAAVIHLTRRMAARLIKDNICVAGIAPGAFASEMNKAAKNAGDAVAKMIPAKRIGRDSDMAGAAVFLASRAGDYVVGDTLAVDGGVAYSQISEAWG